MSVALPEQGLLAGVAAKHRRRLLSAASPRDLEDGEILVRPGEVAERVWLVLGGHLAVKVADSDPTPVMTLGIGEPVGELAAIDKGPRSAWVVAQGPARVLEFSRSAFEELLQRSHVATLNLLQVIANRVRVGNDAISRSHRQRIQSERAGQRDGLTGVYSRTWLDRVLPAQLAEATAQGRPLSLVLLDVDHFKRLNDSHGHPAGDAVLVELGRQLRQRFRSDDLVARYGGEEFAIVLPDVDGVGAVEAAERVRGALAFTGVPTSSDTVVRFTVSAGVAQALPGESVAGLVGRADAALYRAKEEGRDRVVADAAGSTPSPEPR